MSDLKDNSFFRMLLFKEITTNSDVMAIFLSIGKSKKMTDEQIMDKTNLSANAVDLCLNKLENADFIERNPGKASRTFKLSFNGQLFAEQLKRMYPKVEELLGNKNLIEPI